MNKRQRKKHNVYRARVRVLSSVLTQCKRFYLVDAETARRLQESGAFMEEDGIKIRKVDQAQDIGWTWAGA